MLHTLVLCTWVKGISEGLSGSSLCELYTFLLENLCKTANPLISHFNKSQPAPVKCFSRTKYIKPNIQHINDISKAAFSLLFSNERETSIVFSEIELSEYLTDNTGTQQFSLKSGLLSFRKRSKCIDTTCSFGHKTVQEFLAAYHISCNADVIDGIISGYLKRHVNSYLDISQVFVFLCGLNITAANKLSELMNEDDIAQEHGLNFESPFQRCVVSGYREAAANKNTPVHLHLSHFRFDTDFDADLSNIWVLNTSRARSLRKTMTIVTIRSEGVSSARCHKPGQAAIPARVSCPISREHQDKVSSCAPCFEIDLSSCHHLERLILRFDVALQPNALVGLKNLKYLELSYVQCDRLDVSLCHNLERLILEYGITLQQNALVGLAKLKHLKLRHVKSAALDLDLSSCVNLEELDLIGDLIMRPITLVGLKNLKHLDLDCTCIGLDLSYFQFIESMAIGCGVILLPLSIKNYKSCKHIEIMSTYDGLDLSLLENLKSIKISDKVKVLPKQLHIRNKLKRIQLFYFDFNSSDKISIDAWCLLNSADPSLSAESTPVLPTIKLIKLTDVTCSSTWLRSLISTLLTLDHNVECDLKYCQITSSVEGAVSGSSSSGHAIITTDLKNTITINAMRNDCPGLWEAVNGHDIKSLSVGRGSFDSLTLNHVASFSQSLISLSLLETLTLNLFTHIDLQLPKYLKHLSVFYRRLSSSQLRDLVNKLSALTGPVDCRIEFCCPHESVKGAGIDTYKNSQFPLEKYIHIKEDLEVRENVDVKRFRIFDRSADGRVGVIYDSGHGDDEFHFDKKCVLKSYQENRISIRLQIKCVKGPAISSDKSDFNS